MSARRAPRPASIASLARLAGAGSIAWLACAACGGGCAAFTGLTGYSQGPLEDGSAESGSGGGSASGDEAAELTSSDASEPEVSSTVPDASLAGPSPADAASDVRVDAAAICLAQCSGCCDSSGVCHGGLSTATCGTGGAACRDCSAAGLVCGSGGRCVTTQADAGSTPMCVVTRCTNTCPTLPLLEAPCCKPDQTCGCGAVLGILLCN